MGCSEADLFAPGADPKFGFDEYSVVTTVDAVGVVPAHSDLGLQVVAIDLLEEIVEPRRIVVDRRDDPGRMIGIRLESLTDEVFDPPELAGKHDELELVVVCRKLSS